MNTISIRYPDVVSVLRKTNDMAVHLLKLGTGHRSFHDLSEEQLDAIGDYYHELATDYLLAMPHMLTWAERRVMHKMFTGKRG